MMIPTTDGFDCSMWQGTINWAAIPKNKYKFAIIKATEGNYGQDPQFAENWYEAQKNGMLRASYHFLRTTSPGDQQAAYHHSYVRANGRFAVGDACMLDMEKYGNDNPRAVLPIAEAFVREMLQSTQCGIFIYVGYYFWHDDMGNPPSTLLGKCPLVVPSYGAYPHTIDNWPHGPTIWQYSDNGSISGIDGPVDLDRALCDTKTLKSLFRLGARR